ncbi:Uncharacterised protein [uncultured Clostridium sp.]|nr:Uncharacterised protein [uncultured Clostridium sp.]
MTDQEIKALLAENNKDLLHSMQIIIENVVNPKFNLLAEEVQNINERLDRMEKKIDRIEDKVAEHEIKLKIVE